MKVRERNNLSSSEHNERSAARLAPPRYGVTMIDQASGNYQTDVVVQREISQRGATSESSAAIHEAARAGISGNGSRLPYLETIQRSFGRHDITKVVAHTDDKAVASARQMGAVAFATGNHTAFDGLPSLHVAAHEAAHTIQQRSDVPLSNGIGRFGDAYERQADAVADLVVRGESAEHLLDSNADSAIQKKDAGMAVQFGKKGGGGGGPAKSGITMKRKHIHLTGSDKYGHWWTELGPAESYGWWPKYPVGLWKTLFGTEGELNGVTSFGGTPTQDPHHGDSGEEQFEPLIADSTKAPITAIAECRSFAKAYSGEWRWSLGWGQNCHTFQEKMMATVGLVEP